jgi:uncharacterized protein (DUF58 family)
VRRLELAARRNTAGRLPGDYLTAFLGRGLVFHEARRYVDGEPARHIDWNITARVGEPYVRVHQLERQREVFVCLDASPSMHAGWQAKSKLEVAVELAATLAVSAVDAGDRLGWVTFADRVLDQGRPRPGRGALFAALAGFLTAAEPWSRPIEESDPRAAIHAVERHRGRRCVVFLISDFIDHDVPEDLKYVRARHDVSLLHVYDPLEYAAAGERGETAGGETGTGVAGATRAAGGDEADGGAVILPAMAPEGRHGVAGRLQPLAPEESGSLRDMEGFLHREAARHRIAVASFSTAVPVADSLRRFFYRRRRGGAAG